MLGLPDEYDTDYGNSGGEAVTVGRYSVMCEGSYNNDSKSPALWSAGQKISTGWLTDIDTLTVPQDSLLIHAQTGRADDKAYMIRFKENTNEFLLIEQRRKQGFDSHIPGEGLLIYHGQESKLAAWFNREHNNINVNPSDRGWYIETANGVLAMNDAAPFPGSSGIKFFCLNSPNQAKFVNGQPMNVAVTDIHYVNDSVMMFNFNSTQPFVYTEKITDVNKTDAFTAKGTVAYLGAGYQTKGIIYSLDENCPYDENYVIVDNNTDDSSSITAEIKNLSAGTRYYYRAFVAQDGKIILGNTESTVTNTGFGMVYTDNASDIQENSAVLNGNLAYTGEGDYTFIEKGFIYSDDAEAELDFDVQNTVTVSLPDSVKGKYSITVTSLEMAKTYYYRAYVKNTYGTYFGTRKSFVTKYPEITNNTVSDNQNVCLGVVPAELNGELPDGGFGNFTYKWQQRRKGDNWEEAAGVNDGQNYQPELLTDSTYFRRVVISDGRVENTSNTVLIDVRISRGGEVTTFNTTTINTGEILSLGLTHSRGDVVDWERNYNETGWQSLAKSNKDITEVLQEAGQYAYRAIVQIDQCEPDTAQPAAVTVLASSIYDANNTELLTINPNPANDGKFVINAKDMQANVLIITNAAGQVVYLEKNVSLNNKMITLNVESGTYFVTVISDNNVITNKLIINK